MKLLPLMMKEKAQTEFDNLVIELMRHQRNWKIDGAGKKDEGKILNRKLHRIQIAGK